MGQRVEVSLNPHGRFEEWPQFLAMAGDPEGVEFLYELRADGWFCTMRAGGPGGFDVFAPVAIQNTELEEKLWAGATHLTDDPDGAAYILHDRRTTWEPLFPDGSPHRDELAVELQEKGS